MTAPLKIEKRIWADGFERIAGVDEAGRGCLAGPVVAAAVIFPKEFRRISGVTDSKVLKAEDRAKLFSKIIAKASAVAIGICTHEEIDSINILNASLEAMRRAVDSLEPRADFLLVDGNKMYACCPTPHYTVVKGDSLSHSIACASIIAKETRDQIMKEMATSFPSYGFESHKGYPTAQHYQALKSHGNTPIHRLSFNLLSPDLRPKFPD